jgi:hypothetical protein
MDDIFAHIASFTAKTVLPAISFEKVSPINLSTSSLGILCFSKDRPFQLEQFILSIKKYIKSAVPLQIVILYSPGSLFDNVDLMCV